MDKLSVCQVARIAGCHVNSVRNYTRKGLIQAMRDLNGFRKYDAKEAFRLRELLKTRVRAE